MCVRECGIDPLQGVCEFEQVCFEFQYEGE